MKKKGRLLLLTLLLIVIIAPLTVNAGVPYKTYTFDEYGWVTELQAAYTPLKAITKVGNTSFVTPVDMSISKDELIYIADSGAKMILVSDLEGNEVRRIGEGILMAPTGVYVREDSTVYVADKEARKIFVFDGTGNLIGEYGKPSSPIYGDNQDYKPIKVVANAGGTMYVICEGNTNGIVQISPAEGGTFLGYFGTNQTYLNVFQIIQRAILTDAQRAQMLSNIPSTPTNLSIDKDGLILTVTQGNAGQGFGLKKLNIAGKNLLSEGAYTDELCVAVTTGNYKNMFVASNDGYVYEYNEEGEVLFVFGGRDDGRARIGLCNKVEAIGVDVSDRIYLLDSDKRQIHIFEPTEFTNNLHEALYLYSKGRYEESKEPLTKVLEMNSLYEYANRAMSRAYLQEESYAEALTYAKLGKDYDTYSDSFWEVRNVWIRNNIVIAMGIILLIFVFYKVLKMLHVKKGIFNPVKKVTQPFFDKTLVKQIRYTTYFMKHPIDGCYGVRRENKASFLCANLLIGAFILLNIINKYFCNFLYKGVREGRYDLITDIGSVLIIFIALVACNYLVVTINDGEGSIKQLYSAYAYCLAPYILIMPFTILIGRALTYNEVFLVEFADLFIKAFMIILVILTIKEINNYSVKETVKVIALTIFTILIAALLIFVIYVLCSQAIDFITSVGREAVYRVGS